MNHLFKSVFLSLVLLTFNGCDRKKEAVPSYLHINKFSLVTNNVTEGLNTADITDAKVFANGQEVGTFELPVTIPIIAEGNVEITLIPNIRENGSSNYHKPYVPYVSYSQTINLKSLRVDTIKTPVTNYRPGIQGVSGTQFDWMEDFDDPGIALERFGLNNTNDSIKRLPTNTPGVDQPFSGSDYCGLIDITPRDSAVDFERCTSPGWLSLPNLGTDVYVEMDFKSNVNVQVGIFTRDINGYVTRIPVLFTYATDKWRKIYINLKTELSDLPSTTTVRVFFGVYKEQGDLTTHPIVYLDNLKLVYVK